MLVLLSSSARRRYHDDIVRVLAYPVGTEVRFRYSENHIEPKFAKRHDKTRPTKIQGLVCHWANQAWGDPILTPCRFVTVTRVQKVGTSFVFTLRVGEFVTKLTNELLLGLMTPTELAILRMGSFVFEIPGCPHSYRAAANEAMSAFENTTRALRKGAMFVNGQATAFFSVHSISGANNGRFLTPRSGYYELESGRRYFLDVYSYSPEGEDKSSGDSMNLTVSADDPDLKLSSETTAKLDSRYDLNRFTFSTEQRLTELPAGLRIALSVPKKPGDKDLEQRCDITLYLRFAGSWLLATKRVVMIAIGTATPAIIGAYAAGKGSVGLALIMVIFALLTGVATVFPSFRKF